MSKDVVYVRDESNLHIAGAAIILAVPALMMTTVISFVIMICSGVKEVATASGVVVAICISGLIFIDRFFDFYEACSVTFSPNGFTYEFMLNKSIIASSNTKVTVKARKLRKIAVKKNKIVLFGDITKKVPFRGTLHLKKVELPINYTERENIISCFTKYVVKEEVE